MSRYTTAAFLGFRQYLRNPMFIALLVVLPPAFITLSFAITPDLPASIVVPEGGTLIRVPVGMAKLHGAIMGPMTLAILAGILGLFVMLQSREADQRLVMAGYPLLGLLLVRLSIIAVMSVFLTALAVGVTLIDFRPPQLGMYFITNVIFALEYALIGAVAGTFLSAMSGVYLMFFFPMIEVGVLQNPMFPRESVSWWVQALPGYAPMEVLVDVSFSGGFGTMADLAVAFGYLGVLAMVATAFFWKVARPHRVSRVSERGGILEAP